MENSGIRKILLSEIILRTEQQLVRQGYSSSVIRDNKHIWKRLREYALSKGESVYSLELAHEFGKKIYQINILKAPVVGNRRAARALRVLEDYNELGYIRRRVYTRNLQCPESYRPLYEAVLSKCRAEEFAETTLRQLARCVCDYMNYLHSQNVRSIEDSEYAHIVEFLGQWPNAARGTISKKQYLLQKLYVVAHELGSCSKVMLLKFPQLKYIQRKKIPSAFKKEDISALLLAVDRCTAIGKRDYAILLLAVQLGMRASDIRNLKLDDILWDAERIEFVQSKTNKPVSLPLLPETGWALIDYLQHGRPKSDSRNIFLRSKHPYEPFGEFNNLYFIISKYIDLSGMEISIARNRGLHSLRHSLAGAMLGENIALPVISEVLGHSNTQTTTVYIRIDTLHLRECALEVPV